jgi:hypothetical protein
LIEYGSSFLGPLPNIVIFQFNPEQLARTINIPAPPTRRESAGRTRDRGQSAATPTESFTLTAHFSAADDLGAGGALSAVPRVFGIGPQIAALEKMVYPSNIIGGAIGAAIDAIGDALGLGGDDAPTKPIPAEKVPRILFIWGLTRVLPVTIKSMSITEQKFDFLLNPVQAEVQIGLDVASLASSSKDEIGKGALMYTQTVKEAQAILNLVKAVELAVDIIPF